MYKLTPTKIAGITGGKYIGPYNMRNIHVGGAVRDNRDVRQGNLFMCIQGERTDGHLYANSAFDAGATCCLAEKELPNPKGPYVLVNSTLDAIKRLAEYHREHFDIPVIGITGSVGKTTTKELVAAALRAKFNVLKTQKNMNNELGVPLTLLSLNADHEVAVVEMGISDFGEMNRLAKMVKPTIMIMTNIGYSHTNTLGDLNGVLRAKSEVFSHMKPDAVAILNGDDKLLRAFNPGIRKITFGRESHNDYCVQNFKTIGIDRVAMDVVSHNHQISVEIPGYGSHYASLVPAAVAVGRLLGLKNEELNCGFSLSVQPEGRFKISNVNGITLIDDCYNANPSSVAAALASLSQLPGRHVAILGDMLNLGEQSARLHCEVGRFAAKCGIEAILCHGDDSVHIVEGYKAEGGQKAQHYPKMEMLLRAILGKIKKGDAVLVKASHDMHFEKLLPVISEIISG